MSALIESLQNQLKEISRIYDLHQLKATYLGKKGILTEALKDMGQLDIEERKKRGQELNVVKNKIEELLKDKENEIHKQEELAALKLQLPDPSLPAKPFPVVNAGRYHPITLIKRELVELLVQRGFSYTEGPDIETDYYNFEALNIPDDHPARQMHDTFYINPETVLRTHTSAVQIRALEQLKPPVKIIASGRVYRSDFDATHSPMFHQLEGLVINETASLVELRQLLQDLLSEFFGQKLPIRFRPSYFPFTEPSIEVDIGCVVCHQEGCSVCKKTGWIEVLGCGMVHPNVLIKAGLDPEKLQGYAFGLGLERLAMLKLRVPDLRLFFENHYDFLKQFEG